MKQIVILLFSCVLMVASCQDTPDSSTFVSIGDIRLEYAGRVILKYDENTCQTGFNRDKCEFRVLTDNASDYFTVRLDRIPSNEGSTVTGSLKWTTQSSVQTRYGIALTVLKLEGDKIWLSGDNGRIAVCIRLI